MMTRSLRVVFIVSFAVILLFPAWSAAAPQTVAARLGKSI